MRVTGCVHKKYMKNVYISDPEDGSSRFPRNLVINLPN
jgi:hypothetical protein